MFQKQWSKNTRALMKKQTRKEENTHTQTHEGGWMRRRWKTSGNQRPGEANEQRQEEQSQSGRERREPTK